MTRIGRQALGLVNALADHLDGDRLEKARLILDQARPLSDVQALVLEQLAESRRYHWASSPGQPLAEELRSVRGILLLRPDDVELLERRLTLERKVGDANSISEAMAEVFRVAPSSPTLGATAKKWNQEILTAAAKHDTKRVRGLSRRLGPWGGLEDLAFSQMVRSLATSGPVEEVVAFAKAHARRPLGPATRDLLKWLSDRARECFARSAFDDAMAFETILSVLNPAKAPTSGWLDALAAGAHVDGTSTELLLLAMGKDPDLGGQREAIVSALFAGLERARDGSDSSSIVATQDALEVLGADTENSRERAFAAGLASAAPEPWFLSLIARMTSRKDKGESLHDACGNWAESIVDGLDLADGGEVWTLGRRLEAANRDDQAVRLAMLGASIHGDVDPEDLIRVWSKVDVTEIDAERRQHRKILRSVLQAAQRQASRKVSDLRGLTTIILDVAALSNEGLREIDGLIDAASTAGCLDQIIEDMRACDSWSAEKHALAGLSLLKQRRPIAAETHLQAALSGNLDGQLGHAVKLELEALKLRPAGSAEWPREDGTVVLESQSSDDLVSKALEVCPRVYVLAWADIDPGLDEECVGEANRLASEPLAEDRIITIPFRRIDVPDAASAAHTLAAWTIEALASPDLSTGPWADFLRLYEKEIERIVFLKLFPRMREINNAVDAAGGNNTKRNFVIWRSTAFMAVVVRELLRRYPENELQSVCGAVQPAIRRGGQNHVKRSVVSQIDEESVRFPLIGLPASAPSRDFDPDTPLCWVVVPQARPDVLASIPPLISDLSKRWRVGVLFIDDVGDSARFEDQFHRYQNIEPLRHSVETICLKSVRIFSEDRIPIPLNEQLSASMASYFPTVMGGVDVREEFSAVLPTVNRVFSSTIAVDKWLQERLAHERPAAALFVHGTAVEQSLMAKRLEESGTPTLWLQLMQHARDGTFVRPPSRHHLVIDRYSKALWGEHIGVSGDDVTIVGSLRIDQVFDRVRSLDRISALDELGLSSDTRVVLVATQTVSLWENIKLIEIAIQGSRGVDSVAIVVKLHPGEPESRIASYEAVFSRTGFEGRAIVTKEHDTYRAIVASEIVVVQHSNVGIEAMLMDRPVVSVVTNGGRMGTFSLADHGFVEEIADLDDAVAYIRSLLTDPVARTEADDARSTYLRTHPELTDGNASQRIADAIQLQIALSRPDRSQT